MSGSELAKGSAAMEGSRAWRAYRFVLNAGWKRAVAPDDWLDNVIDPSTAASDIVMPRRAPTTTPETIKSVMEAEAVRKRINAVIMLHSSAMRIPISVLRKGG